MYWLNLPISVCQRHLKRPETTPRLYCTALYWTVLPWTALHCTALHSTVLQSTALWNITILNCTVKYCTPLNCTILHCIALCNTALYWTELNWTELHYIALHCTHCIALLLLFTNVRWMNLTKVEYKYLDIWGTNANSSQKIISVETIQLYN